jgi:hypothetical protein
LLFAAALAAAGAVTGCGALLDVKDIYFDPDAGAPGSDGGGTTDGPVTGEGSAAETGTDSSTCFADLMTDAKNCGRCGHDCLQGTCTAGKCQAAQIGSIPNTPLFHIAVSDQYVFVSTRITLSPQTGGAWRIPKAGGTPEVYVNLRYAEEMAIVGDKLYFVVDDSPQSGGMGQTGGLYSCPLVGAAPCAPTLIASATDPTSITVDQNKIYYNDNDTGRGLMVVTPPAAPTVFRADFGFGGNYVVDGNDAFYSVTIQPANPPNVAKVFAVFTDGGVDEKFRYESDTAFDGRLIGAPDALLFTAYDFSGTTGGVVRRIARDGGTPCSYGATGNKRPYGIYADGKRVYWVNQGDGADEPYQNGSIASCDQSGCCTVPDVHWTGNGQPAAIGGDADAVYFATYQTGTIWKLAKP